MSGYKKQNAIEAFLRGICPICGKPYAKHPWNKRKKLVKALEPKREYMEGR